MDPAPRGLRWRNPGMPSARGWWGMGVEGESDAGGGPSCVGQADHPRLGAGLLLRLGVLGEAQGSLAFLGGQVVLRGAAGLGL